jgi:cytochrome c oxidase cbb3-type subunit 2
MPGYPWLAKNTVNAEEIIGRMKALKTLGDPYTDADIDGAAEQVSDKTEQDAVVAYLQGLGKNAPKGEQK